MFRSILLAIFSMLALSSCMTVATLNVDYKSNKPKQPDPCAEYCSINRVYSGVSMDLCLLSAPTHGGFFAIWDLPLSLVADTVILPYTLYRQASDGGKHTGVLYYNTECKQAQTPLDKPKQAQDSPPH